MNPFGIPQNVLRANAQCFTAALMKELTKQQGIEWKTALAYAPMSNGRVQRMVQTGKESIGEIARNYKEDCEEFIRRVVYGYRRRPLVSGCYPFELMYGVPGRIVEEDEIRETRPSSTLEDRYAEIMSRIGSRATRAF